MTERDWNDVAASQGMPRTAGHHQEQRRILPRVSEGARTCPCLDLGFLALERLGNTFLLLEVTQFVILGNAYNHCLTGKGTKV